MQKNDFVKYLFDRPVDGLEWYFREDYEDPDVAKGDFLLLATHVFDNTHVIGGMYSERQVCMGLRYLINPSCGPFSFLYLDTEIEFEVRRNAISSMGSVFRDLFAEVLKGRAPFQENASEALSYGETCYMWWDLFPRHGSPRRRDMEETDVVIFRTISSVLQINVAACQESALHGLGHWFSSRPDDVVSAIKSFLPLAPPALKQYALKAMEGNIQ